MDLEKRVAKDCLIDKCHDCSSDQSLGLKPVASFHSSMEAQADLVNTPDLKQSVCFGCWFIFKMHQPVKLLLDISPSLNSHHNNMDIWRGMCIGKKITDSSPGKDRALQEVGGGSRTPLGVFC